MLRPLRIAVLRLEGLERLQAATEALAARLLEGRLQAGMVVGSTMVDGVLYGLYEAGWGPRAYRRITGGPKASLRPDTVYAGIVYASESLEETVQAAETIVECLGAKNWGATRMGPRRLAAGIIEVVGDYSPDQALECTRIALRKPRPQTLDQSTLPIDRLSKPYLHPKWRNYTGADPLPCKGAARRGDYMVRIGLSLWEDTFIADARIDGVFNAAPPMEPFSTLAGITGMPVGEQALLALETRFSAKIELHGITPEDVVEAFRKAIESRPRKAP